MIVKLLLLLLFCDANRYVLENLTHWMYFVSYYYSQILINISHASVRSV